MSVDCTPAALAERAKCVESCLPPGAQLAALVSLFCTIANNGNGGTTTPQSANTVFAGPTTGAAAAPTFRALVSADLGTTLLVQFGSVNALRYYGTVVALGSGTDVDWSLGTYFTKTLSANTTFTFSNTQPGQCITVILTNTASNFTVSWPTTKWPGAISPIMSIGAKNDVYTIFNANSAFWGSYVQNVT